MNTRQQIEHIGLYTYFIDIMYLMSRNLVMPGIIKTNQNGL